MMLDDTYIIEGDVRSFLNEIRGDQFGDSYSLTVKSHDVEYISNRITKTEKNLRYIYTRTIAPIFGPVAPDPANISPLAVYDMNTELPVTPTG